jgi:hypothetical protein
VSSKIMHYNVTVDPRLFQLIGKKGAKFEYKRRKWLINTLF